HPAGLVTFAPTETREQVLITVLAVVALLHPGVLGGGALPPLPVPEPPALRVRGVGVPAGGCLRAHARRSCSDGTEPPSGALAPPGEPGPQTEIVCAVTVRMWWVSDETNSTHRALSSS